MDPAGFVIDWHLGSGSVIQEQGSANLGSERNIYGSTTLLISNTNCEATHFWLEPMT